MASNDDIIRVTARLSEPSAGSVQNVWHFRYNNLVPVSDALVAIDAATVVDGIYNDLESILLSTTDPVDMLVHNVTTDTPMGTLPFDTFGGGAASGEGLPPGVAALLTLGTGVLKVLGRKYFGSLSETANDSGAVSAGVISALFDLGEALLTPYGLPLTGSLTAGVIDKNGTFRPFTSFRVATQLAYQRRRKLGRGI